MERIPRVRDPERIAHMMDPSACRLDDQNDVWHCMLTTLGVPTFWRGLLVWKNQHDLYRYFRLIQRERFAAIVETGCQGGGSGVFFMDCLAAYGVDALYIGVDIEGGWHKAAMDHAYPHVYIKRDCLDPETVAEVRHQIENFNISHFGSPDLRKVLVVLDSVHTEEHVTEELRLYAPLAAAPRSSLVVEDTDHNGRPVLANYGPCGYEAVEKFLKAGAPFVRDTEIETRYGAFTNSPGGWLRRAP